MGADLSSAVLCHCNRGIGCVSLSLQPKGTAVILINLPVSEGEHVKTAVPISVVWACGDCGRGDMSHCLGPDEDLSLATGRYARRQSGSGILSLSWFLLRDIG